VAIIYQYKRGGGAAEGGGGGFLAAAESKKASMSAWEAKHIHGLVLFASFQPGLDVDFVILVGNGVGDGGGLLGGRQMRPNGDDEIH